MYLYSLSSKHVIVLIILFKRLDWNISQYIFLLNQFLELGNELLCK